MDQQESPESPVCADNSDDHAMRVGVARYSEPSDEELQMLRQLGVRDVLLTRWEHDDIESAMPPGEVWSVDLLSRLVDRMNQFDVRLYGLQTMPVALYEILLSDDRDRLINIVTETIRNMGEVGIPVLGYSGHPPSGFGRTSTVETRGGAEALHFDSSEVEDCTAEQAISETQLWHIYEEFLEQVLPVAESAGVTLALHPTDPPVQRINGIPMLFRDFPHFKRAMELVPSDNHGLKFCLGCWSQMGESVPDVLRYFGGENLVYVHFRDVVGTIPEFSEAFIDDERTNWDEFEILEILDEIGFRGVLTPDHVPRLTGEPEWEYGGPVGYAFTIGYMKSMINSCHRGNDT